MSGCVVEKVGGGVKFNRPDGAIVFLHEAGDITIENIVPKSVGIEELFEFGILRDTNRGSVAYLSRGVFWRGDMWR